MFTGTLTTAVRAALVRRSCDAEAAEVAREMAGVQGNARLAEASLDEEVAAALDATDKDVAPHAGLRIGVDGPDQVQVVGENFCFSLIEDGRPLTEHVHLAFSAQDDAMVRAFHAAARPLAVMRTTAVPESAPSTTRATTVRSCWTPTGSTSRSSTTTSEP